MSNYFDFQQTYNLDIRAISFVQAHYLFFNILAILKHIPECFCVPITLIKSYAQIAEPTGPLGKAF